MGKGHRDKVAVISGGANGIGQAFAKRLAADGAHVAVVDVVPGDATVRLVEQAGREALAVTCDVSSPDAVAAMAKEVERRFGRCDILINCAGIFPQLPFEQMTYAEWRRILSTNLDAVFAWAQEAARRMLAKGAGAIIFTGASASVKGYPLSAPFAMGKFALRGLAQSMARELAPQGIHVAHVVVDGGIRSARRPDAADRPDSTLDPDAIAASYLHLLQQERSAWTWEIELRPWVEKF